MAKPKKDNVGIVLESQQEIHNWLECLEAAATLTGPCEPEDDEQTALEVTNLADRIYDELLERVKA